MPFYSLQSNFNRGELSPDVELRSEKDWWYGGAKELTNCRSIPQGGVKRRPGLRYKATLTAKSQLASFEFNISQVYIIAFSDLELKVFLNGTLVATIVTAYTEAQVFSETGPLRWAQQGDTMIVVHESHAPRKLVRNVGASGTLAGATPFATVNTSAVVTVTQANHGLVTGHLVTLAGVTGAVNGIPAAELNATHTITFVDSATFTITVTTPATSTGAGGNASITYTAPDLWTFDLITFVNTPNFNFADSLTPTETDEVQVLQFAGGWLEGERYRLGLEGQVTDPSLQYSTTGSENVDRIREALQRLPNTANAGTITVVDTTSGADPKGPFTITFSGADGNRNWGTLDPTLIKVNSGGTIAITADGTGSSVIGASGQEPVWSVLRGYPRSVTFHEQRLCFGGSLFRPSTSWLSRTNEPFDFDLGLALDDDAIEATAAADRLDTILDVLSIRNLTLLTAGSEFYSPEAPITPRNIAYRRDTARGASHVRPVVLDGSVLFIQRDKKALRQWLFNEAEGSYVADDATIIARHMLNGPRDMDVQQGPRADYVMVVNETDGQMAVLNINRAQGVGAWSHDVTRSGDKFVSVAVVRDSVQSEVVYVCVERSINSSTVYYLEQYDDLAFLDSSLALTGVLQTVWTGLSHLEGETVKLKGDGKVLGTAVVASGQVTTATAVSTLEVGFNSVLPIVESMPVTLNAANGRLDMRQKKIARATVDMLDSNDVYVSREVGEGDEYRVDPAFFGFTAAPSWSGPREQRLFGWNPRPTVRVTQREPLPFTLRAIEIEVEVRT